MNKDLQILIKYPEFYALKTELVKLVNELDDLGEIDLEKRGRLTIAEEVAGRQIASKKVKDLLKKLGLVYKADYTKQVKTYE